MGDSTIDELVALCVTIEPKLGFACSPNEPLDEGDGGRLKARIELAKNWTDEWLPMFNTAKDSCPWASRQIVGLRTALANAIIRGGNNDLANVFPARVDLECASNSEAAPTCYVTLLQMAGIVSRSKRTLERLSTKPAFPPPAVDGGGGKPNEWRWADVRPILESEYTRTLPEVFPADRFVSR